MNRFQENLQGNISGNISKNIFIEENIAIFLTKSIADIFIVWSILSYYKNKYIIFSSLVFLGYYDKIFRMKYLKYENQYIINYERMNEYILGTLLFIKYDSRIKISLMLFGIKILLMYF